MGKNVSTFLKLLIPFKKSLVENMFYLFSFTATCFFNAFLRGEHGGEGPVSRALMSIEVFWLSYYFNNVDWLFEKSLSVDMLHEEWLWWGVGVDVSAVTDSNYHVNLRAYQIESDTGSFSVVPGWKVRGSFFTEWSVLK